MSVTIFARTFPESICSKPLSSDSFPRKSLYVDVSGLVRSNPASCPDEVQRNVIQIVKDKVEWISPQKLLVAFDGSLPLVKLADRRRRIHKQRQVCNTEILSMAGTSFMNELSKKLAEHFKAVNMQYVLSPMSAANESACKIASAIGKNSDETVHIVCGVESIDAFTIALLENKSIFFDISDEKSLDLTALRHEITTSVNNISNDSPTTCLRDICFFLTLDRLAPLPDGRCLLVNLIDAYGHALRTCKARSMYNRTMQIDKIVLKNVFMNMLRHKTSRSDSIMTTSCVRVKNLETRDEMWESKYWKTIFNIDGGCVARQQLAMKDYCKGLVWLADSMNLSVPDWHWYYNFEAAPPMQDIIKYIDDIGGERSFVKNRPLRPLESLSIAMPS